MQVASEWAMVLAPKSAERGLVDPSYQMLGFCMRILPRLAVILRGVRDASLCM